MYYCKTRYYVPEWCRWLNADNVKYLDPRSLNGLNLYAYCGNNPIMFSDPSGCLAKWLAITFSVTAIVAGVLLCATGVGGVFGGVLIGAGAGSLINGYITEANGGDFTAGYIGGAVSGALCALGAGVGGLAFSAGSNAAGMACIGYVALGAGAYFAGGFAGNIAGTIVSNKIENNSWFSGIDWNSTIYTSTMMGGLNVIAGLGSCIVNELGIMGNLVTDINSKIACRLLAVTLAAGTEVAYDIISYLLNYLKSLFE